MSHPILQTIARLGTQTLAAQAAELDRDPETLRQALQLLGQQQLLALKVPLDLGGSAIDPITYYQYQETLTRYSGALAFLQTQHQSAIALLAHSQNLELRQQQLPACITGQQTLGIAFSHLRRSVPLVKAMPRRGGYAISGHIPWITGWGIFDSFILAAVLPDDRALYVLLPLRSQIQPTGGSLQLSLPMPLIAMTGTQTVTAEIHDWFVPEADVVTVRPAGAIHTHDRSNVLSHSAFSLGCAQAGLDYLQSLQHRHANQNSPTLDPALAATLAQTIDRLAQPLQTCRSQIYQALAAQAFPAQGCSSEDAEIQDIQGRYEQGRSFRAQVLQLALQITQMGVIASKGAANRQEHPAGRLYREAMAFSVTGQTQDLLLHTLTQQN
ncbi:MAG: acyl-CoA dehydrogenase family protein [Synechococcales bacterium]|nr:acyl-CoA dehydrogenase family protein [Synechococcales bacterium]